MSEIANEILSQLGGNRFLYMIGAKALFSDGNTLTVRFTGRAKGGINMVKVTLEDSDTYTVIFQRHAAGKIVNKASFDDVYCDTLVDIFESTTGLYTSL